MATRGLFCLAAVGGLLFTGCQPRSLPEESSGYPIELATGVALAQTLPSGTAMGFSVTYRFGDDPPDPEPGFVWVIESSDPEPHVEPVELESGGGELYTYVTKWRPEDGPFRCFIRDESGTRLSETIDLE